MIYYQYLIIKKVKVMKSIDHEDRFRNSKKLKQQSFEDYQLPFNKKQSKLRIKTQEKESIPSFDIKEQEINHADKKKFTKKNNYFNDWPSSQLSDKFKHPHQQQTQKQQHKKQVQYFSVQQQFEQPIERQVDPVKLIQLKNFETSKIYISRFKQDPQNSKISLKNISSLYNKHPQRQVKLNQSNFRQDQQVIPCPYCAVPLKLIQLDHMDTCSEGRECFYCKQRYPNQVFGSHLIICPQREKYYAKRQLQYKKIDAIKKKVVVKPNFTKRQDHQKRLKLQKDQYSPVDSERKNRIYPKPAAQSKPQFRSQALNQRLTYNKNKKPSVPQLSNNNRPQKKPVEPKIDMIALENASKLRQEELKGLSRDQIQLIGAEIYFKRGENEEECLVCTMQIDEGQNIIRLPCSHIFHQECLIPWLQQRSRCPTCKNRILEL